MINNLAVVTGKNQHLLPFFIISRLSTRVTMMQKAVSGATLFIVLMSLVLLTAVFFLRAWADPRRRLSSGSREFRQI